MIVQAIYHGLKPVGLVYQAGEVIFENIPVEFHLIEDGKLIILGALSAISTEAGLYLDCNPPGVPDDVPEEWEDPVLDGTQLTVRQVYAANRNGDLLEVE